MNIIKEKLVNSSNQVIELGENFIINQQVHDKNLIAKPFKYCKTDSLVDKNEISLLKTLFITPYTTASMVYDNLSEQTYIVDSMDSGIVYRIVTYALNTGANGNFSIYKYRKTNDESYNLISTYLLSISTAGTTTLPIPEFIHQDEDTLWLGIHSSYTAYTDNQSSRFSIKIINKSNINERKSFNFPGFCETVLGFYEDSLYLLLTGKNNIHKITRLVNGSADEYYTEDLFQNTTDIINNNFMFSRSTELDEVGRIYFAKRTGAKLNMAEITLSIDNTKVEISEKLIDLPIGIAVGAEECNCSLFNVFDGDERYFILVVNGYPNNTSQYSLRNQGFYVFKFEDGELEHIDTYKFQFKQTGFIAMNDNKRFIFCANSAFFVFDWDTTLKTLVRKFEEYSPIQVLGVDSNNNVWVQGVDFRVDLYSETLPDTISARFAEDGYKYEGTDIESHITVYSQSFIGEYLSVDAKLSLGGNVRFAATGEKIMSVKTPTDKPLEIPVIINGSGQLSINIIQ